MWHPDRGHPAKSGDTRYVPETVEESPEGLALHIQFLLAFKRSVAERAEIECLKNPHGELLMALAKHLCHRDRGGDLDAICLGQNGASPVLEAKGTVALYGPFRAAWECYLPEAIAALELVKIEPALVTEYLNPSKKRVK